MNGEFLRGKRPNFREQQPDKNLCKIKMAQKEVFQKLLPFDFKLHFANKSNNTEIE